MGENTDSIEAIARQLAEAGCSIAIVESLTGGMLASTFARMSGASEFFRGAIVAYAPEVKFGVLGVTRGPVVTQKAADEMACGSLRLLGSDLGLAVTGVGGPGPEEGKPAGSVFVSLFDSKIERSYRKELHLTGNPGEVCSRTCKESLMLVQIALSSPGDNSLSA